MLYPRSEGSTFDSDYYVSTHMPLVGKTWPDVTWAVDLGGDDQPYHCIGHLAFDSTEAMGAAFGSPGAAEVMADPDAYPPPPRTGPSRSELLAALAA